VWSLQRGLFSKKPAEKEGIDPANADDPHRSLLDRLPGLLLPQRNIRIALLV